jgi:hypothetical protein
LLATRRRASSRRSTATPQQAAKPDTQTSEYIPSQALPPIKTETTPTLRRQTSKKRKSSSDAFLPPKPVSRASDSADPKPTNSKQPTPSVQKPSTPSEDAREGSRAAKKRRLTRKVIEDSQPEFPERTAPLSLDPIEVSSVRSPSPVKPVSVELQKVPSQTAPESPARSSQRQSRSRKTTPSSLAPPRNRSLSPVTKVDSWLSIASDNDFSEAIAEHQTENFQNGSIAQSLDPIVIDSSMNPSSQQVAGPVGPGFTPIQTLHRQMSVAQSNRSVAGSPSPTTSIPGSRAPIAQPVRRQSGPSLRIYD